MKITSTLFFTILLFSACTAQVSQNERRIIGGPCQDCESTLDFNVLNIEPKPTVTIKGFENKSPKIRVSGTVFHSDGRTPAENVILYIYQTNLDGIYEPGKDPIGFEKRHGQYRGWMKTDANGNYEFQSFRPGGYPDGESAEHIHIYVLEPGKNPYYIDPYVFDDDPLLTLKERASLNNRGGSGILKLELKNGILTANRNITLGLNIPNY